MLFLDIFCHYLQKRTQIARCPGKGAKILLNKMRLGFVKTVTEINQIKNSQTLYRLSMGL